MKQITPEIEDKLWEMSGAPYAVFNRNNTLPLEQWEHWSESLAYLKEIEASHEPNEIFLHKYLNILDYALTCLLENERLIESQALKIVELARDCITRIPRRFKKNSPYGSACESCWIKGHEALAQYHPARAPEWNDALLLFQACAGKALNAPRSHCEENLLTARHHNDLFKLGREMNWMSVI